MNLQFRFSFEVNIFEHQNRGKSEMGDKFNAEIVVMVPLNWTLSKEKPKIQEHYSMVSLCYLTKAVK
jgi:hypothetical protein